jgi:putative IMPACT (imprinted ancient) family translation regulator
VFRAELHPATDGPARDAILAASRKADHDATHHCSAWRAGLPVSAWGSDDDGEPSGTAGRPMLKVLEGAGLTDCLAVCLRWFGGTKLGTGGLVRAYTEALQGAIAQAEAEGFLETLRELRRGRIQVAAESAHLPFALLGAFPGTDILSREFGDTQATLHFTCPPEAVRTLEEAWRERSRGGSILWE